MQTTKANGAPVTHRMIKTLAGTEPRSEIRSITPEQARKWLSLNSKSNRRISVRTVEAYAREMVAGRWQLTHQAIAFNQTGELVDGQHRLNAIVASGVTIKAYVSTGLPLEYNAPIDQGYGRRIDQVIGRSPRWVSVVRGMFALETANLGVGFKTQVGLIEELGERHGPAVEQVMAKGTGGIRVPSGFHSVCAFAFPVAPEKILAFVEQVGSGELLVKGDPAHTIRRWIQRPDRRSPKENMLASANAVKHLLTGKQMINVMAGRGDEREGVSGYLWICQRRRALRLPGTPSAEIASFKAMAATNKGDEDDA